MLEPHTFKIVNTQKEISPVYYMVYVCLLIAS